MKKLRYFLFIITKAKYYQEKYINNKNIIKFDFNYNSKEYKVEKIKNNIVSTNKLKTN